MGIIKSTALRRDAVNKGEFLCFLKEWCKIKPSATLAMDTKAKAMKAKGLDIVNFGVGA